MFYERDNNNKNYQEKVRREKNLRDFHRVEASSEEQKLPPRVKDRTGEIRFKISFSSSSRGDELKEFNLDMLPRKYISSGDLAKYNRLPFFNDQVDYSLATDQLKKFAYHELVEIFFVREAFVNFVLAKCHQKNSTSISNVGKTAHDNLIAMLTFLLPNLEKRVVEWTRDDNNNNNNNNKSVLKTIHPTLFDIESDYVSRLMLDGNIYTVYNVQLLSVPKRIDFYREYMVEMSHLVNWRKKNSDELKLLKQTFQQEMNLFTKFDSLKSVDAWINPDEEMRRRMYTTTTKYDTVRQMITTQILPLLRTFKTSLPDCNKLYKKLSDLRRNNYYYLLKTSTVKAIDDYMKKYYHISLKDSQITEYDKVMAAAAAAATTAAAASANSSTAAAAAASAGTTTTTTTTTAATTAFEVSLKAAKRSSSSSSSSGRNYGYYGSQSSYFGRGGYYQYDDDDDDDDDFYRRRRSSSDRSSSSHRGSFADIIATLYHYHKYSMYSNKNDNDNTTLAMIGLSSTFFLGGGGGGSIMDFFDKYHTFLLREKVNGTTSSSLKVSYIAYLNVDVVKGDVTPENRKSVSCFLQKNKLIAATDKFFAYAKNALNSSSNSSSYFKTNSDEAFEKRVFIDLSGELEEQKRATAAAAAAAAKTTRSTTMKKTSTGGGSKK